MFKSIQFMELIKMPHLREKSFIRISLLCYKQVINKAETEVLCHPEN